MASVGSIPTLGVNKRVRNMEDKREMILKFLKSHSICVIATVNGKGAPEAAAIEFGENEKLELIFDTFSDSRKVRNIMTNKRVAVVIGWDDNITLQYEGNASRLTGRELNDYKVTYFAKNPRAKKWEKRPEVEYFKVEPSWMRYSDLNSQPWEIFEVPL